MSSRYVSLAIDFGTEHSCIATMTANGPRVIPAETPTKDPRLPSAVFIDRDGRLLVGSAARGAMQYSTPHEGQGFTGFKLHMGTDRRYEFTAARKSLTAPELGAIIIQTLLRAYQKDTRHAMLNAAVPIIEVVKDDGTTSRSRQAVDKPRARFSYSAGKNADDTSERRPHQRQYHNVVGIDLGLSHSAVSVWDYERKKVVVIPSAIGELAVPSVIGVDDDQNVVVGRPAQRRLMYDPLNSIIEIRREMGVYERRPDPWRNDPGVPKRVRFRDRDYLPQEISAFILAELKRQAEIFLGEPVHDAVITVPAYFSEAARDATLEAAALAQLAVKQLLNEPVAAAVAFGVDEIQDGRRHFCAVYDLGRQTFSVSIAEVEAGRIGIIAAAGSPYLGGGDFDDAITDWALAEIQRRHNVDVRQDQTACARIRAEAEACKRDLSIANSAMMSLPFLTPHLSVSLIISRAVFNSLIDRCLQESLQYLAEVIQRAVETRSIRKEDIEQVLLAGGSSRIPRVRAVIAEFMDHLDDKDIRSDVNPEEAISRGAALVARSHRPTEAFHDSATDLVATGATIDPEQVTKLVLVDVTSHTLGIQIDEHEFFPLIPKESRIPAQKTIHVVNAGPSSAIQVLIYQGEQQAAFANTYVGILSIPLPEPKERGYWRFDVTFLLDSNGLLRITAKRLNDDETFNVDVDHSRRSMW